MTAASLPLQNALYVAAALQLCVALLNLRVPRLLKWERHLNALPLLVRQVFYVHACFISITLTIFGILTIRFAPDLARGSCPIGRWLCASIAVFWGIRTVLQFTYYSSSHWRGNRRRTVAHVVLIVMYGGFASVYAHAEWSPALSKAAEARVNGGAIAVVQSSPKGINANSRGWNRREGVLQRGTTLTRLYPGEESDSAPCVVRPPSGWQPPNPLASVGLRPRLFKLVPFGELPN